MAYEAHHGPHFVVIQNALPGGHAAETDAVLDDDLQLTVGEILHAVVAQFGNIRRHLIGEGHPGVVAVQPVTNLAMMAEMFLAGFTTSGVSGNGFFRFLPVMATRLASC